MSQVVIGDILPYTQATAILNQTVFGTNWTADVESDVVVYVTPPATAPNDVTQILPYPAGYSVAFIGSQQDVQVTLVTPSVAGAIVTITRQTPADRENLYSNTNFTPSMLNSDFGILTLVDQQAQLVDQKIGPRYNYSAIIVDVVDTILPILAANQGWVKNNGNTAIIPYTFPSGGIANADATYVTITDETATLPNSVNFAGQASGITIFNASGLFITRSIDGTANQLAVGNADGIAGNPIVSIVSNPLIPGTAGMGVPQGTTAQRVIPASGISFRYNTDSGQLEFWDGVTWTQVPDSTDFSSLPTGFVTVTTGSGDINSRLFVATANQIDITNTDGLGNPAFSLSATLNFPGSFTVQSSTAITGIINDSTMASATTSNLSTSAAIKAYVDSIATGLNVIGSCVAGSTVALTVTYANGASGVGATLTNAGVQAAISLDGVSPTVGQRVLIKNQASSLQNGVYTVTTVGSGATNWVLTRATDFDAPAEINPGDLIVLTGGSTQNQSSWLETATVTAVGTDPITFVQFTASLPVNVASGGTGVTSFTPYGIITGGITSTGSLQQVTIGAAGTILQSGGASALPGFSTATYPSVATSTGSFIYANGTNFVASTSLWPNTVGTAGLIIRSNGTINTYSTAQYPDAAGTAGNALVSDGTNFISSATVGASATSVIADDTTTNATMFPVWVTANTGSLPLKVTSTKLFFNPSTGRLNTTSLQLQTYIYDLNGNIIEEFFPIASAVNHLGTQNGATGQPVYLAAVGTDSNILMAILGKGTSGATLQGVATNTTPTAGFVGEEIESVIDSGSAVSLTNGTDANVTSVSLTAGDWDVWGNISTIPNSGVTTSTYALGWISSTSATLPNASLYNLQDRVGVQTFNVGTTPPARRFLLAATTTIYLSCQVGFGVSTMGACGGLYARRRS